MSKNLNDIAREIAQNDDIKSELPKNRRSCDHVEGKTTKWFSERDRVPCFNCPHFYP
jgi:hypothetical protein